MANSVTLVLLLLPPPFRERGVRALLLPCPPATIVPRLFLRIVLLLLDCLYMVMTLGPFTSVVLVFFYLMRCVPAPLSVVWGTCMPLTTVTCVMYPLRPLATALVKTLLLTHGELGGARWGPGSALPLTRFFLIMTTARTKGDGAGFPTASPQAQTASTHPRARGSLSPRFGGACSGSSSFGMLCGTGSWSPTTGRPTLLSSVMLKIFIFLLATVGMPGSSGPLLLVLGSVRFLFVSPSPRRTEMLL